METHWLFQILLSLVKSTLIQCPLITFCSSTETEYCPRRRKKRFISGPNSSDEGRSDEDNVKLRTRAKSEISSHSRLRWFSFIFCQHTSTETLFVSEFQKRLSRWSLQEMWKRDQDPKDKGGENGSAHPAVAGVKVQQDLVSFMQKTGVTSIPHS